MPRTQMDASTAVSYYLPELVKQLKLMNELKAFELKCSLLGKISNIDMKVYEIMNGSEC